MSMDGTPYADDMEQGSYEIGSGGAPPKEPKIADPVKPDHYTRLKFQPRDVARDWGLGFNLGNVLKYLARHRAKGGIVDLKKALDNLQDEIDHMEAK